MINRSRLFVTLAGATLVVSCDDTCGTGYVYRNHVCIQLATGTGGSANTAGDGGSLEDSGTDSGGGSQTGCSDSTFGDTCLTVTDCGCDTGYCAGYPGQQGICSHSGCLETPSVCPSTWVCQDFSAFQPGLSLCTPP
jgi:hypothetical protein